MKKICLPVTNAALLRIYCHHHSFQIEHNQSSIISTQSMINIFISEILKNILISIDFFMTRPILEVPRDGSMDRTTTYYYGKTHHDEKSILYI